MAGTRRPGDPFIEHPDQLELEEDDGKVLTFCWRDHARACTGGCQAFDPDYADDETGRWTSCRLINVQLAVGNMLTQFVKYQAPSKKSQPIPGVDIKPPEVK